MIVVETLYTSAFLPQKFLCTLFFWESISTFDYFLLFSSCLEWRYTLSLLEQAGLETWALDILGWGFNNLGCLFSDFCIHIYNKTKVDLRINVTFFSFLVVSLPLSETLPLCNVESKRDHLFQVTLNHP